ncbi:lysophospholipid acyltransferase family protein, partial [Mesorhizobium japonicum]|uniref:lysophospholipid acyltransferase family protein n=1 Tax=Mesorhizobium japonicum TaxID=2066070 RepID=UPI003B5BB348
STGVPIIPVALIGAGEAHPRGSSWPKPGRLPVGVVYGDPMDALPGETAGEFMVRVRDVIESLIAEHGPRILHPEHDPAPTKPGKKKAGTESGGAAT